MKGLAYQNIPKKKASHFGMNWWNGWVPCATFQPFMQE